MPLKTTIDEQPNLNLTSMIDVLFLMIIFFMVATTFSDMERNIALEVPRVSDRGTLSDAPEKKVINVYQDGQITLDRKSVSLADLPGRLTDARRQYHELGVLVRGDAQSDFQHVAEVLMACRQAGIADLNIAVRRENTTK